MSIYTHRCGNLTGKFIHDTCTTCGHLNAVHTVDGTCAFCEHMQIPIPVTVEATDDDVYVVVHKGNGESHRLNLASAHATDDGNGTGIVVTITEFEP